MQLVLNRTNDRIETTQATTANATRGRKNCSRIHTRIRIKTTAEAVETALPAT
jgi:hypothetical protein